MYNVNENVTSSDRIRSSFDSVGSGSSVVFRNRPRSTVWRPSSLINLVTNRRPNVLQSFHSRESADSNSSNGSPVFVDDDESKISEQSTRESNKKGWSTIVTIVIVEARIHSWIHNCTRFGWWLGSELYKSKSVPHSNHAEWRERLNLHLNKDHLLLISLWDKGKQKNFMGSTVIDLSCLEKERTHEIWQQLHDGFGSIHLNVTMCEIRNKASTPDSDEPKLLEEIKEKYAIYNLKTDWGTVGQLHVKLVGARGLSGKPKAYCTLELDNERVQTHNDRASAEPVWNKNYVFNVYDVTSTLDLKVYDSLFRLESLGRVSIPLLSITNGVERWYAFKDKNKRNSAKGNCPRVLLKMSLIWNPVKATLRLFRPKEVKYIKKPPKFEITLFYNNLKFISDILGVAYDFNEGFKRFLEWDNRELSAVCLAGWLIFWYHFKLWTAPLFLLIPFIYFWISKGNQYERSFKRSNSNVEDDTGQNDGVTMDGRIGFMGKVQDIQEMSVRVTSGIDYIHVTAERVVNLLTFKVPFLSYLTMLFLVIASFGLYFIPFNFVLMALGTYKYIRKHLNPNRILNNDLLDFISRIPDNETLKDWNELRVPEPKNKNNVNNNN